jgi:hypothetical protein
VALMRGLKDHAERIGQTKARLGADHRRHHGLLRRDALGLHPRAGIRRPDQGQAGDAGSLASSRTRCAMPSTTGSPPRLPRRSSCLISWSSGPTSACAAAPRRTCSARPPCASCACPASWPIVPPPPRRARNSSSSRAIRPAARPSRRATGNTGRAADARQDPQRRQRHQGQADRQPAIGRPAAGARLRLGQPLQGRRSALRQGHHHDRRGCRRRAYRLAADHLLLPPDAEADRGRASLPRHPAALSPQPRRQVRLCAR